MASACLLLIRMLKVKHSKTTFVTNLGEHEVTLFCTLYSDQDKSDITHRAAPDLVIFAPDLAV